LNLLRVALGEALDRELLEANPAKDVKVHRAAKASAKDPLDGILAPLEQQALIAAVPELERPVVVFALCTGLRQSEQWWLRWEDVFPDHVLVRRSAGGLPPKNGKPRRVPLLPAARAALDALRGRRSPWVFPARRGARRQNGKPPRGWSSWLAKAKIDRPVRWHDLRHTCATSLLAGWWSGGQGWSLPAVSKLLGHSSVQVTERYARKLDSTLSEAVANTAGPVFPGGIGGAPQLGGTFHMSDAFVKHRSSVQSRLSAPVVTRRDWDALGTSQANEEEAFRAALAEDFERAEAFALLSNEDARG
jgi:integrase